MRDDDPDSDPAGPKPPAARRPPTFVYDLAAVFDQLHDSVGVHDRAGHILHLNAAAARLYGRAAVELIGASLWEVRPDGNGFARAFERAAQTGTPELFDHYDHALDRHFEVHIHAVGDVVFVLARDVTEAALARRRLDALAELTALAQATQPHDFDDLAAVVARGLDADCCAITLLDADRALVVNGFHDLSAEAAVLLRDEPAIGSDLAVAAVVLQERRGVLFADTDRGDGRSELLPATAMLVPLCTAGETIGLLAVGKRTRPGLRRYTETDLAALETFADRVAVVIGHARDNLRRDALHREVAAARAAADRAGRAKDEFLALLGHELRNPLAPIRTALDLMEMRAPETLTKERRVIERQVGHLRRMVDDLLDVARIAQGKIEITPTPLDLRDVVTAAIETASPLIELRHHVLEASLPPSPLIVFGDEHRLCQVFANLLRNAARYTNPGGHLRLAARVDGQVAVVTVGDDGVGMTAELLPHVFDLFVQGLRDSARVEGGLGLGLAIVRSLVALHGGTVTAVSDGPDRGSTFEVRLPLCETLPDAIRPPAQHGRRTGELTRLLVVDDNQDAAETLSDALSDAGFDVRVAHDGPSALVMVDDFRPAVALLDIGLPVMDGFELAGRMRESLGDGVRLIAVTGYGQASDRARVTAAGFIDHLVKPVSLDDLLTALSRATAH